MGRATLLPGLRQWPPATGSGRAYVRLQYRRQMEIAEVGTAAYVELDDDDTITTAITALTAVIRRVPAAEAGPLGSSIGRKPQAGGWFLCGFGPNRNHQGRRRSHRSTSGRVRR